MKAINKFFRLESMMGETKKQLLHSSELPLRLHHFRFDLIEQSERPGSCCLWTFNLFSYPWLYRISHAEATEIKCFQINRYDNKTSNFEASENVWKNKILTSLWYSKLWFSKMTTAGFTYTNVYPIKLFQYFRHLLIPELRKILLASKEIPA